MWENMALGSEFAHNFCAWFGPLQLDVVLVDQYFVSFTDLSSLCFLHPSGHDAPVLHGYRSHAGHAVQSPDGGYQ